MANQKMTEKEIQDYLEDNSDMIFGTDFLYGNTNISYFEKIHVNKKITGVSSLGSLETIKDEFKV